MQALSIVEQALVITVIGVVSIFAVLFVLWGLMAALVRVTAQAGGAQAAAADATVIASAPVSETDPRRRAAAAAAVAVALALDAQRRAPVPPGQPPQAPLSPWQSTIRGSIMSQRAGAYRRNPPPRK